MDEAIAAAAGAWGPVVAEAAEATAAECEAEVIVVGYWARGVVAGI